MAELVIKASLRAERGRQNSKIRKKSLIPAVVYGHGQKNLAFSMDIRSAEKCSKKEFDNKIFTLESEDKNLKGLKVIKKSISRHAVSRLPLHMDFLSLDMSKPIRVQVDIKFTGVPKGVKEEGGALNITLRQVELECLPNDIPAFIELDVSDLSLNQNIHVSGLKAPEGAKLITRVERTVCAVVSAAEEEEEAKTEGASPEETAKKEEPASPAKPSPEKKS